MRKTKYVCPNCGGPVLKVRWDAGYQYCKDKVCFQALGKRTNTFEKLPQPGEVDLDPYDLDDIADMFDSD